MKLLSSTALALAALAFAAPALAQAPAQPQAAAQKPIKLSAKAGKAIMALQTAVNANDAANIPARVAEAKAVASTPDDRYAIGQLELKAAVAANNNDAAAAAVDDIVASGFATPAQVGELASVVGGALFKEKKFDRAAAMFDKAVAADPNNGDYLVLLAETKNAAGQSAAALQVMQKALALKASAGAKAPENTYKRAFLLAYGAESPLAVDFGRQWLAAYPSPESWHNALAVYRNTSQLDVQATLDLLRLMRATNALTSGNDYLLLAQSAAEKGNFGEAQAVMDEGIAAKKVDPSSGVAAEVMAGLKGKPKATAADLATASKDAKTATAKMAVGNRYYGMGNYAEAAAMYREAAAAGGDANLANLHLGMALARSGDKAGAITALKAVTGQYAGVAAYWLLYAQGA